MDRQSTIGFVLIFVVLVVWMWLNSPVQKPRQIEQTAKPVQMKDTVKVNRQELPEPKEKQEINPYGKFFSDRAKGTEKIISIETEFYYAEISTKGGVLRKWELKKFKTWDGCPVQLVDNAQNGDFTILLTTSDGRVINTKDLYFDVQTPSNTVKIDGSFEFEIKLTLPASNGGQLVKKMKFRNQEYGFETEIQLVNMSSVIANYQYEIAWEHGIRYAERNSVDESGFAAAYAYAGNELTEIDASKVDQKVQKEFSGAIDWVAARNKYFAVALIPMETVSDGAYVEGNRSAMPNNGVKETYDVSLKMPYKGEANEQSTIKVFLGPLQHNVLKSYNKGLENIMSLGWAWLIRPISEYIMLPIFIAIHYVVPNWGLVIIIFSVLIKLAMHPLSKSQMKSMKKMQKLQPLMDELRDKI